MNAEETICRAIANRHRLAFVCGDELCVVEPHQLGSDGHGDLVLLAYLVEEKPRGARDAASPGGRRVGAVGEWRVYRVADFFWALESNDAFDGPRPGYEPAPNTAILVASCQL